MASSFYPASYNIHSLQILIIIFIYTQNFDFFLFKTFDILSFNIIFRFFSPSLSISGSQTSPIPSPSASSCPGLYRLGQLSQASPRLSLRSSSRSCWSGFDTSGQLSCEQCQNCIAYTYKQIVGSRAIKHAFLHNNYLQAKNKKRFYSLVFIFLSGSQKSSKNLDNADWRLRFPYKRRMIVFLAVCQKSFFLSYIYLVIFDMLPER